MINAQEWLDKNYPKEKRSNVNEVKNIRPFKWNLSNKVFLNTGELLEGELTLDNWPDLEWIDFINNKLTKLTIINCPKLTRIEVSDNHLIDFNCDQPEVLSWLDIGNNKFPSQELAIFSKFINLENLNLAYNYSFVGSLEPLKNLTKLEALDISYTCIDDGLEYLSESLERIFHYIDQNSPTKVKELHQSLEPFKINIGLRQDPEFKDFNRLEAAVVKTFPVVTSAQDRFNKDYYFNYQSWRKASLWKSLQECSLERKQSVTNLDLSNQNLTEQPHLSEFTNLEILNLANNPISGSLQFLQNLTKLKELNISNTEINSGLEYLPKSLETFTCHTDGNVFTKHKVSKIENILKHYNGDIRNWRKDYITKDIDLEYKSQLLEKEQQIQELKAQLEMEKNASIQVQKITSLQEQKQSLRTDTKNTEQKVIQVKFQIQAKEQEIIEKEVELEEEQQNPFFSAEEIEQLKQKLSQLRVELSNLKSQLEVKEKELVELNKKNIQLVEQCLSYLRLIKSFREKQQELNRVKESVKNGDLSLVDELCQVNSKFTTLDNKLSTIIKQQTTTKDILTNLGLRTNDYDAVVTELGVKTDKEQAINHLESESVKIILELVDNFLKSKQVFLNTRQTLIKKLQVCYDKLETSINIGKYAKIDEKCKVMNIIGEALSNLTLGISKAVSEAINIGNDIGKRKFTERKIKEFQNCLENDSKKLFWFIDQYNSLLKMINKHKDLEIVSQIVNILGLNNKGGQIFRTSYEVYGVIDIWKGMQFLSSDDMKNTIKLLSDNLKKLEEESKEEKNKLNKIVENGKFVIQTETPPK